MTSEEGQDKVLKVGLLWKDFLYWKSGKRFYEDTGNYEVVDEKDINEFIKYGKQKTV